MKVQCGASFVEVLLCASIFAVASSGLIAHFIHATQYTKNLQTQRLLMDVAMNTYADRTSIVSSLKQANQKSEAITLTNGQLAIIESRLVREHTDTVDENNTLVIAIRRAPQKNADTAIKQSAKSIEVSTKLPASQSGRWQDIHYLTTSISTSYSPDEVSFNPNGKYK